MCGSAPYASAALPDDNVFGAIQRLLRESTPTVLHDMELLRSALHLAHEGPAVWEALLLYLLLGSDNFYRPPLSPLLLPPPPEMHSPLLDYTYTS